MRQLLSDVTVLELANDPAGSYCGKVFADLGADVVKVEPPGGDPERQHPERYQHLNTNKRAVRVTDDDAGRAQLLDLVASADVVIESKDAGDLAGFGLVRDDVRAQCPAVVVATISGFGTTPNKAAALGENIILLANLAWSAWLIWGFVRRRTPFATLERWQTGYLPVYAAWAWIVVLVFPPLFSYA